MKIEEQLAKAKSGTPERAVGEYLLERMKADEEQPLKYIATDSEYEKQYRIYVSENEVVKNGR